MNNTSNQNSNAQDSQDPAVLVKQVNDELEAVNKDIKQTNSDLIDGLDEVEKKVNKTVKELDGIYADLDKIEVDANNELDSLVLEQATEMDEEDSDDDE